MRMTASLCKWAWAGLVGLAAAYAATAWMRPVSAPLPPTIAEAQAAAAGEDRQAAWLAQVRTRNVLRLESPAPTVAASAADPSAWPVLGIFTGKRPAAIVNTGAGSKSVSPGQELEGWTVSGIEPGKVRWKSGEAERESGMRVKAGPAFHLSAKKVNKVRLTVAEAAPLLGNAGAMLQQALFKPFTKDNEVAGFRVDNIQENSMLRRIGLEDGDVLLRINGEKVTGPDKLLRAYSGLGRGRTSTLDVLRGDDTLSLVLEIN
jgi:general secretion pathway protein C